MAKATTRPAAKPNLFARAAEKTADKPKKKTKGTALQLPKDLNTAGELQGESKVLNEAVSIAITAKAEMDAAKGRLGAALDCLKGHAEEAWCATYAENGVQPETPVVIMNHKGETLTLVVQDKCGQNPINDDQLELLGVLLGTEVAASLTEEIAKFGFDPNTMKEAAAGEKVKEGETVQDVIFEIVSAAVSKCSKLSDEQKENLFTHEAKTYIKRNTLPRLAELCGSNVGKIQSFLQAAGSAIVRYMKV